MILATLAYPIAPLPLHHPISFGSTISDQQNSSDSQTNRWDPSSPENWIDVAAQSPSSEPLGRAASRCLECQNAPSAHVCRARRPTPALETVWSFRIHSWWFLHGLSMPNAVQASPLVWAKCLDSATRTRAWHLQIRSSQFRLGPISWRAPLSVLIWKETFAGNLGSWLLHRDLEHPQSIDQLVWWCRRKTNRTKPPYLAPLCLMSSWCRSPHWLSLASWAIWYHWTCGQLWLGLRHVQS